MLFIDYSGQNPDILGFLLLSPSLIIIGLVMSNGVFSKGVAYLGIVTGVVVLGALIPVYALGMVIFATIALILLAIWLVVVGYKLYKLG